LGKRCSSPRPTGNDWATSVLRVSFLFCASDPAADRTVSTTLSMAYSAMFRGELAGLDLGDVEHGVDEAEQVPAVGANAGEGIERFRSLRLIKALLHELGVTKDSGERGSELMAHVGHEPRLVLAGDFEFTALLGDVVEQPHILYRNNGLIGKRLDELNLP